MKNHREADEAGAAQAAVPECFPRPSTTSPSLCTVLPQVHVGKTGLGAQGLRDHQGTVPWSTKSAVPRCLPSLRAPEERGDPSQGHGRCSQEDGGK